MEESNSKIYSASLIGFFLIVSLSFLVLPLYFWLIPMNWGKAIAFRIILSVLIFFFFWQVLSKDIKLSDIKNKIKSASPAFWLLMSFLFISLLATISSLDVGFSLWGDPVRGDGFVNLVFYIIFSLLIFLVIKRNDWQKLWDFTIIIGVLMSLVAIFQQFGVLKEFLVPLHFRPSSTTGNPIFLATYLLLLTFLCFSFAVKSKNIIRRIFYYFSFLIFLVVSIFLTQTRAAILGLIIGFLWFSLAYPKKLKKLKFFAAVFLILIVSGAYSLKIYLDSHLYVYQRIPSTISSDLDRALNVFEGTKEIESRISAWKVSLDALRERPVLGYGPENFEIAFDKHYDPSLPIIGVAIPPGTELYQWWDRAHNFLFDISITAGLPALAAYLCFFVALFWQLQKLKKREPETAVISHGLQATFIGYLTATLFSFDCFDTYLILFLSIGYAFFLMSSRSIERSDSQQENSRLILLSDKLYQYRKIIAVFVFLPLAWFILVFNLKPLKINNELNSAYSYFASENYGKVFETIDRISLSHSILDNYTRTKSVEIIQKYNNYNFNNPKLAALLTRKSIWFLQENIKASPNRLRNWLPAGENVNFLISQEKRLNNTINPEELLALKEEANYYFSEASLLSPKRPEVYKEWAKTGLLTQDYEITKEKAQKCIDLSPDYNICYWLMALSQGYLKNNEQFNYYFDIAKEKKYDTESKETLAQLINMYMENKDYKASAEYYQRLISIVSDDDQKAQLYTSLADIYKKMGEFKKAEEAALKVLDFQPAAKTNIDKFLETLR